MTPPGSGSEIFSGVKNIFWGHDPARVGVQNIFRGHDPAGVDPDPGKTLLNILPQKLSKIQATHNIEACANVLSRNEIIS